MREMLVKSACRHDRARRRVRIAAAELVRWRTIWLPAGPFGTQGYGAAVAVAAPAGGAATPETPETPKTPKTPAASATAAVSASKECLDVFVMTASRPPATRRRRGYASRSR